MLITTETIAQSIFFASIFLMALSLPKIFILFFWSLCRIKFFDKVPKYKKNSFFGICLRKMVPESFIKEFSDEKYVMSAINNEMLRTTSALKIPMIESISSIILMSISSYHLGLDSTSSLIVVLLIVLLIISLLMGSYYIHKYYSKAKPFLEKYEPDLGEKEIDK